MRALLALDVVSAEGRNGPILRYNRPRPTDSLIHEARARVQVQAQVQGLAIPGPSPSLSNPGSEYCVQKPQGTFQECSLRYHFKNIF